MNRLFKIAVFRFGIVISTMVVAAIIFLPKESGQGKTVETSKIEPQLIGSSAKNPKIPDTSLIFPKNFMWGVATSAFQNEGGDGKTDWDNWPVYKNHSVNHPGLTQKDISLAKELGIKYFRFSIEWAKVEPKKGTWDRKAIGRYFALAQTMRKNGIEPFVNLNHFTLPQWVALRGGWENDSTAIWFGFYAKKIAAAFKPLKIKWWMTFNEPTVLIDAGYLKGSWPPEKSENDTSRGAMQALRNLKRAHRLAYKNIHDVLDRPDWKIKVGIAHFSRLLVPYDKGSEKDRQVTKWLNFATNHDFIESIEDKLDYLGLNYYSRTFVKFNNWSLFFGQPVEFINEKDERTDDGMEIYPPGIYELIAQFRHYKIPIIITENGVDDKNDRCREKFITEHLRWLHKALNEARRGEAPILGYFYWTFTDNAEWEKLKPSHFGLVAVDSITKERKPRRSAYFFREVIKKNGLINLKSRE